MSVEPTVNKQNRIKLAWFERMESAGALFASANSGFCFCPGCLHGFERDSIRAGVLTLEHVPPRALGGRPIMLTCRDCNNAGHKLDADMQKFDRLLRFRMATLEGVMPVSLRLGSRRVNATMKARGNSLQLFPVERANPPGWRDSIDEWAESAKEGAGWKLDITFRERYHDDHVAVGLLRTAYLAAFAKFGYTYITRPDLALVRDQISRPKERVLPSFTATNVSANGNERLLMLVHGQDFPDCVIAQIGVHLVFLPPVDGQSGFYDSLAVRAEDENFEVKDAAGFLWPTRPELISDFSRGQP